MIHIHSANERSPGFSVTRIAIIAMEAVWELSSMHRMQRPFNLNSALGFHQVGAGRVEELYCGQTAFTDRFRYYNS
jgi:hypothetical protein